MKLRNLEKISLLSHPELNEKWVQNIVADQPSILGLGELVLKDKERIHPKAGRLDLLFEDENRRRYEVELQLGKIDESHIIRTIEYWDIERRRFPKYDHCAVVIAEDITSRFLNVISLFNGYIPLIAIQMTAYKVSETEVSLLFTTVLDEFKIGDEEQDEPKEATTRSYWESKVGKPIIDLVDGMLRLLNSFAPGYELNYTKFYIGLAKNGRTNNFVIFTPRKNSVIFEFRHSPSPEIDKKLEAAKIESIGYDSRWGKYRIRIDKQAMKENENLITEFLHLAHGVPED